jgi:hypothetical protein
VTLLHIATCVFFSLLALFSLLFSLRILSLLAYFFRYLRFFRYFFRCVFYRYLRILPRGDQTLEVFETFCVFISQPTAPLQESKRKQVTMRRWKSLTGSTRDRDGSKAASWRCLKLLRTLSPLYVLPTTALAGCDSILPILKDFCSPTGSLPLALHCTFSLCFGCNSIEAGRTINTSAGAST